MATNAGIAALVALIVFFAGLEALLWVHLPIVVLSATIGVWLFYVQHQFEDTHWREDGDWNLHRAALAGSSYYKLPGILRWLTANIGIHHVHHLCSRIPFYRLPEVLRDHPELRDVRPITILESLRCARLKLWDEERDRLVAFSEVRPSAP
jgi:omega-6 fatty acid desaturase (delta-12 desaturase)